jgi:hypothetical protein
MHSLPTEPADKLPVAGPRRFTAVETYVLWFLASLGLCYAVAWMAFQLQQEQIAPAVLFPLLVGAALGAGGSAIRHFTRAPNRRIALVGAVVWGLLVVVGQDYIGHRHRVRQYDDELGRHDPLSSAALSAPDPLRPRFAEYLAGVVRRQPVWWSLEVALTSGAALLVTAWGASNDRSTRGA